ncbi:hypothetical protein D3C85_05780 [compost metagenome]
MQINRHAGTQQQFARTRFCSVAIIFSEFRFEVGRLHVVVVGRIRIRVNRVTFRHRRPHFRVAHHHDIEYAHFFKRKLILAQFTQALIRIEHDGTGRRVEVAAEDFHESGLAAAVGADQAVTVAIAKLDGNVFKQRLGAELHRDISCR